MLNRYSTSFNVFLLTLIFLVYLLLGAELFSTLERPTEREIVDEILKNKRDFLEKFSCVQGRTNFGEIRQENKSGFSAFFFV